MATTFLNLGVKAAEFRETSFPSLFLANGLNAPIWALAFDAAADEAAFWRFPILRYGSGNLTLTLLWTSFAGSSGNVVWGGSVAAITPDADTTSIDSKAFAAEATVTDAHLGTTADRVHRADITITGLDGVANQDLLCVRVRRLGSNGSDTMVGDAALIGAILSYSDT
jgi:hypothetical protein